MPPPNGFCPYVGLRPYTEEDRAYFFGRDREQRIITSNLLTAPLTILYGPSGCGKSSVLRAAVLPSLSNESGVTPVYLSQWQDAGFVSNWKAQCLKAAGLRPNEVDSTLELDEFLRRIVEKTGRALTILLDQFEEYLLYHADSQTDARFESEFARAVNRADIDVNFLIGIREDSISKLDRFRTRISNLLSNTLRLEQLNADAARRALRLPLETYNRNFRAGLDPITIEEGLVERVVAEVRTGEVRFGESAGIGSAKLPTGAEPVETAFLQLVMTRLWEEERKTDSAVLRLETLATLGGAQHIVETYLDRVMKTLSGQQRDICARMFRYMVTPSRTKIAQSTADLVSFAGQPPENVKAVLTKLDDARVLRRIDQLPERYEIFHDVLAGAVLDWCTRYTAALEATEREKEATRQQQFESARLQARRFRRLTIALIVLFVACSGAAFIAVRQEHWAVSERANAQREAQKAIASEHDAEVARLQAEAQTVLAKQKSLLAADLATQAERDAQTAERLRHLTTAAQLTAASGDVVDRDAPLGALLALYAMAEGSKEPGSTNQEAQQALYRTVAAARPGAALNAGHDKEVRWVTFSPDGKRLATSSWDNTAKVWDSHLGRQLLELRGHDDVLFTVVFSPDGKRIATASADKTAKVWDAATGTVLLTLTGHTDFVWGVAFSPDGKRLATSSADGTVRLWNADSGQIVSSCCGHERGVISVVFSPDGRRLATAGYYDNTAKMWVPSSGLLLETFAGHTDHVVDVAFSPDGRRICTASKDGTARIWDASSGKQLRSLSGHTDGVNAAVFSPDGKRVATAGEDKTARIWDADSGNLLLTISGNTAGVMSVAFDPKGERVATGGQDGAAMVWDAKTASELLNVSTPAGKDAAAFDNDGTRLATAGPQSAQTWELPSRRLLAVASSAGAFINDVSLSWDGRRLATADNHGVARVWDATSGVLSASLSHGGDVRHVAFSPDASLVATAGADQTVKLWKSSGELLTTLKGHSDTINSVAFDSQGKRLVTASTDQTARLWDLQKAATLFTLSGSSQLSCAAFSPDGSRVITAGAHGGVPAGMVSVVMSIWDANSGKASCELTGHTKPVYALAFSADGTRVASTGDDKTARVWDVHSCKELLTFTLQSEGISIVFSADGKHLFTYDKSGATRDFLLDLGDVQAFVRNLASKATLTPDQCHRYFGTPKCPPRP